MNWEQAEGKWKQVKGSVKAKWGKLTDSDLDIIAGKHEQLVGRIQERYGIAKEEAEKQVKDWNPPGDLDAVVEEQPRRKVS
ncbi:MAG TPA: CsbD family protein [Candidatus Angelobacter sp.]|nr:CsbD family protein [Candidatus Angelobacter sp.]